MTRKVFVSRVAEVYDDEMASKTKVLKIEQRYIQAYTQNVSQNKGK